MWPFDKKETGVSLHDQISSYGSLEQVLEEALAGYRAAIDSVVNHTPRNLTKGTSGGAGEWRKNLRQVRARLEGSPSAAMLKDTARLVDRELSNWGRATEQGFEAQEQETKEAMAAVAVMAEVLGAHEKTYGVRFRGISKKLRLLTTSSDITEIRKKLQSEIELLEQYVDEMAQESQSALSRLRTVSAAASDADEHPLVAEAVKAGVRTEDRVACIVVHLPAQVEAKGAPLVMARLTDAFESPVMTGLLSPGTFLSVSRLPLPEAAVRLDIVERDLSSKLGMRLDASIFEKTPGQSALDLLAKAGMQLADCSR